MANVAKKLTDLIGNTPLLEFSNFNASKGLKANRERPLSNRQVEILV